MVSIIKNQLLKHLSRYTKNLSADKINLSTFKGEGELSNLELDEAVLTDLLELPSWLRLTSAWCNKVSFRIQWTKLKSVPIFLSLDEVIIKVETCPDLRSMSTQQGLSSFAANAKYSFINKVVDGMTVAVNTVKITFHSPAFVASVQMSRILVESKSPAWQRGDLRVTRLKDPARGQLLIFKELEWQAVRVEARATRDEGLTPLRLLTNHACCRITIKKRLSDCFVLGSRLVLILDDLLWVLTDSQLKAALTFLESLGGLVQRATERARAHKAARKLEVLPEYQAQVFQQERSSQDPTSALSRIFSRYDVVETSYHFLAQRIDLHLCDDAGVGRSEHPDLSEGAAFQVSVQQFQVDYYPYHLAWSDRKHWPRYREGASPHSQWLKQALVSFKTQLMDVLEESQGAGSAPKATESGGGESSATSPSAQPEHATRRSPAASGGSTAKIMAQLAKLMTSCLVLRIQDFTLYQVTTSQRKQTPHEFVAGDRERFSLPDDITILHAEFTYYYYPGDTPYPLPPPQLMVQLNPVRVFPDVVSCLWLHSFAMGLHQSLSTSSSPPPPLYVDVKVEAIMPRVVLESTRRKAAGQRDRPHSLHIQVSRATLTNVRSAEHSPRSDLARIVSLCKQGSLFLGTDFPAQPGDTPAVSDKLEAHATGSDGVNRPHDGTQQLWTEARDVWDLRFEPVWADWVGALGPGRPVPFLDAVPLSVWLHAGCGEVRALASAGALLGLQLDHYQLLALLRLADQATELSAYLTRDSARLRPAAGSLVLAAVLPQAELTFVMPSQSPGKESSGGDLESVLPDSGSLPEEKRPPLATPISELSSLSLESHHEISSVKPDGTNGTAAFLPNNLNVGLSSVRKGFSNFMTSLDSALKPGSDDDTLSVRSDASSDSERYVMVTMSGEERSLDAMFRVATEQPPEVAAEVLESEPSSPSDEDDSCPRKDLVSMATLRLSRLEILQHASGFHSAVALQLSGVATDECGAIPWDELQSKFSCRSRASQETVTPDRPCVRLRLTHEVAPGVVTGPLSYRDWCQDHGELRVNGLELSLNMSTVIGLADLAEDEELAPPLPLQIFLEDVTLHLNEDRPPVNITSPGPQPLDVCVTKLSVVRGTDGVFHVEPVSDVTIPQSLDTGRLTALAKENTELRRRLSVMNEQNATLHQAVEESQVLRRCLTTAQDDMARLLEEKRALLDRIRNLTEQVEQMRRAKR